MLLPLLLSLSLAASPAPADDPPVRLWLSSDGHFKIGDRARVYVETADDGYLVVLRADAGGRVRVLFPVDPSDDNFVRGGKKFEIRWRGVREAFYVEDQPGNGVVVAAWSHDPFKFDDFTRNDHWDYRVLGAQKLTDDPEGGLLDIVARMSGGGEGRFEHDVASYSVVQPWRDSFSRGGWWGDPWGYRFRLGLAFGSPFGFYNPFFYDPFRYSACYDPFLGYDPFLCSGFGYSAFYPFRYGYYRPVYARPVFVGGFGVRTGTAPRFVVPRDRVIVTPVEPRRRTVSGGGFAAPPRMRAPDRGGDRPAVRDRSTRSSGGWTRSSPSPRSGGWGMGRRDGGGGGGGGGRGGAAPRSRRH